MADWFSGTMSALAVAVALAAYPITNWQKRSDEKRRDAEIGRAIGWKALNILNRTADIDRHFRESLQNREQTHPPGMKFPLVQPLGLPEKALQELNQSEIDFLLKAKAAELLSEIEMCITRYASISYAMNEYKNRHEALYELMPPPIAREGVLFTHRLNKSESDRVGPYAIMLETLLERIVLLTAENMERARSTIDLYNKDMTRHFGRPLMEFDIAPVAASQDA